MDDRLLRGTLASLVGSLFIILVNSGSYYLLHFAKAVWLNMISQLVFGHPARNVFEYVLGFFLLLIVTGGLGFLYAMWIHKQPGDGNYYFRATAVGYGFWLGSFALGTLYKMPGLSVVAWETAVTNIVSVTGWGLITGYVMKRWDKEYAG